PVVLDDPNFLTRDYDKFTAYRQSKTANILMAIELDARLASSPAHAYSVHPGVADTELGRHRTTEDLEQLRRTVGDSAMKPKTLKAAAATRVWATIEAELVNHGGAYLEDCQVSEPEAH